ncbi:MAG: sugar transferase [Bacteroidetes bacterium]|nr:sugar transferase [Bacteroidota bacterium]
MLKRIFDLFFSMVGLIILAPFLFIISISIIFDSRGGIFYTQKRVGKDNIDFSMFKFRTMRTGSDKKGLLTIGDKDSRITNVGYFLRKYKIDELPQLINILKGNMSFVGPRPEVRKYVDLYSSDQLIVLSIRPGITDFSSLDFINESEILSQSSNPEETYINEIMQLKLELCKKYIKEKSFRTDLKIITKTILKIIGK